MTVKDYIRRAGSLRFRCEFCGRFVSLEELESGLAEAGVEDAWDWARENHTERDWCHHVACYEEAEAKLAALGYGPKAAQP